MDGLRREVEQAVEAWSADLRGVAELLGQQENRLTEMTRAMAAELEEIAAVLGRIPPELDRRQELLPEPSRKASRGLGGAEPPDRRPSHGRENALLRAAQMAVAGSSRDEIEQALAAELHDQRSGPDRRRAARTAGLTLPRGRDRRLPAGPARDGADLLKLRERGDPLRGAVQRVACRQHQPRVAPVADDVDRWSSTTLVLWTR